MASEDGFCGLDTSHELVQRVDHGKPFVRDGEVARRPALRIPRVHLSAYAQQQRDGAGVAALARHMQRRRRVRIASADVDRALSAAHQCQHDRRVASPARQMQRLQLLALRRVRVGTRLEQQAHYVLVAQLGRAK